MVKIVLDTFCGRFPVFAVTHVGKTAALVEVSSVIAVLVAFPAVKLAAVPVAFVRTIDEGVPPAPLSVTNAPADPTFVVSAVDTPVPNPVMLPTAGVTVAELAAVMRPFTSHVRTGVAVELPALPAVTTDVSVSAAEPGPAAEPSPVRAVMPAVDVQPLVASERSPHVKRATVNIPPAEVCFTTCEAPPVALKSTVPAGHVIVPEAAEAGFHI